MNAIEVKNLKFGYSKDKLVVDDVSFEIKKGSYVSIIGHNGCGKSTLAKLLDGLLSPLEGEIYILGEKLSIETLTKIRQQVAIVFQNPDNQFIGATVEDDVAFGLENRRVERKQMHELINEYLTKV